MEEKQVLEILGKVGAVITNSHIVYTSGKHGSAYVNKDAVYPHTFAISSLCRAIAEKFVVDKPQVVIAPAIGGVILSQLVAYELTNYWFRARIDHEEILGVYAEHDDGLVFEAKNQAVYIPLPNGTFDKENEKDAIVVLPGEKLLVRKSGFVIKRGYDKLIKGKRVLVVEDILTTGGSVKKVIEATRAIGGEVVGLGVLCNRGGIMPQDVGNVPKLFSLVNIKLDAWSEADCPLCAKGVPINTDVGKGREFLARKK